MNILSKAYMNLITEKVLIIWFKILVKTKFKRIDIERIGTTYGGWSIPVNLLNSDSVCYLAGAGEDISFDVGIVNKYNSRVYILDPTPRAYSHYELLIQNTQKGLNTNINNEPDQWYDLLPDNRDKLNFLKIGLWSGSGEIKFFEPKNSSHVSHSALNLQNTQKYFIGKVKKLSELMKELNHDYLDLLKIDIEGAEYEVIKSIIQDKIQIKVICVEFDEANHRLDNKYLLRIITSLKALFRAGYRIIDYDNKHNYTLIRKDTFIQLTK
jgi:FkbM family methyltransferase